MVSNRTNMDWGRFAHLVDVQKTYVVSKETHDDVILVPVIDQPMRSLGQLSSLELAIFSNGQVFLGKDLAERVKHGHKNVQVQVTENLAKKHFQEIYRAIDPNAHITTKSQQDTGTSLDQGKESYIKEKIKSSISKSHKLEPLNIKQENIKTMDEAESNAFAQLKVEIEQAMVASQSEGELPKEKVKERSAAASDKFKPSPAKFTAPSQDRADRKTAKSDKDAAKEQAKIDRMKAERASSAKRKEKERQQRIQERSARIRNKELNREIRRDETIQSETIDK